MKKYIFLFALIVMGATFNVRALETIPVKVNPVKHGNVIRGHVIEKDSEEHLPYATVLIVETGQGTVTDENGHFVFDKIPEGSYTLRVRLLGYATQEKKITVSRNYVTDVHVALIQEGIVTDEVVVSANRNEVSRKMAPVVVNVMSTKLFETVNSTDLAKSLNFQSGL